MAIKFLNTVAVDTDVLYVDASNNRVGIGTDSPNHELVVQGTSSPNIELKNSNYSDGGFVLNRTNYNQQWKWWAQSSQMYFGFSTNESTYSNKMTIQSGGNVGIGTTSPAAKLEVEQSNSGTGTVFLSNSYNNKGFRTGNAGYATFSGYQDGNNTSSGNAYGALIGLNTFYNGTSFYNDNQYVDPSSILFKDGDIKFHTNDVSSSGNFTPNERLRITKAGNVGIGTTSPSEKLEVNGTVKATASTDAYKGYIKNTITCTPLMKTANTNYNYIPYNSTIFGSTPDYYNRMAAAYDGRVKKIILRHVDGVTPTATGMKFKKEVNGTVSTTEYTATVTGGASANFTAIYNFANSDFTFSEGDSIGILAQTSGGTGGIGGASVQIIVEYNIT